MSDTYLTQLDDNGEEKREPWFIDYGGKRPMEFAPFMLDDTDLSREQLIKGAYSIVYSLVNFATAANMDDMAFFKLVEKMSITICKYFSPTKNLGIKKSGIRTLVLYIISEEIRAIKNT